MAEKVEDLNLPASVVTRIIKECLPDGVNVSKEARVAVGRAASVFVLYITSSANNIAAQGKKKTISGNDVLKALSDTDFDLFIPTLHEALEAHKKVLQEKQKLKIVRGEKAQEEKAEVNGDVDVKLNSSEQEIEDDEEQEAE